MDFLSLFDPTDGNSKQSNKKKHKEQDNVKKKTEGPKGRRRGRKSSTKHETLPEESSFLCEPDLSTDILVKDVSYIEHFIEINKKDDDTKSEERKPKRRNSSRKSRRRKKNSPVKENETDSKNNLNNKSFKPKPETNIGKNVNDLKKEFDESKFDGGLSKFDIDASKFDSHASKDGGISKFDSGKSKFDNGKNGKSKFEGKSGKFDGKSGKFDSKKGVYRDSSVYNVIDKLEKVSLKDDMYLAGDFNTEDLESDFFYCSDDEEEFIDDSTSEGSDSAEEVYGSLPPEPRFGNVEYKLRLSSLCEKRFQHLVTQLKWRLISGGGSCVYVVGVRDCGALAGLRARALRSSLCALRRMARALPAAVTHVTARRVAPHRAVAEVIIKKIADPQQSVELRIAVMGANEAGKSTLIGVLTQGELDNGTGSARLNMFRHQHEVKTGRTSSLSHEILGFDAQGNVVNYGCSSLMTAERIGARSAKLVAFLDLAGHSKYQRTTRLGLTGYSPHYAMLTISATAGISPITEEHMGLLLALKLPFFVVINKCELNATAVKLLVARLESMLASHDKKPLLITDENLARNCCAPQKLILDSIDKDNNNQNEESNYEAGTVPVFPVSCVRGCGLAALHAYLLALQPPPQQHGTPPDQETCEFQIDEIFHVGDSSGPVVGGLLTRGQLYEGDKLLIGPLDDGSFRPVSVRSVYRNRVPHGAARAGQPASLSLHTPCPQVRPGMVLLAIPDGYKQSKRPTWGGCTSRCKTKQEISEMIKLQQSPIINNKDRKHKKHKNLLQDLAKVENELIKDIENDNCNIFKENYIQDKKTETNYIENKPILKENEPKDINKYKKSETIFIESEPEINDLKLYKKNETSYVENEPIFKESESKSLNYKKSETNHIESEPVYIKNDINNLTYKKNEPNYIEKENEPIFKENETKDTFKDKITQDISDEENQDKHIDNDDCICDDKILLEDPTDPRGCIFFQATVHVLRHSTAISPGFQCTVHVGNVRQTAIIEGIMSRDNVLRAGGSASALFRFVRCPEYLVRGRQLLFTAGLGTRGTGRITQIFPFVP